MSMAMCLTCSVGMTARAAGPDSATVGGLPSLFSPIPLQEPRPSIGEDAGQQWPTGRVGPEASPMASFVDSLKGSDSAMEVIVGQTRLLTLKSDIAQGGSTASVAVGDPTVLDFQVLPNPRMIRLIGNRAGVTDLSITTGDGQVYTFEVHVGYDLPLLRAQLREIFPDSFIKIAQLREHLVVEGQARSDQQISQIIYTIEAYLQSVVVPRSSEGNNTAQSSEGPPFRRPDGRPTPEQVAAEGDPRADFANGYGGSQAMPETQGSSSSEVTMPSPKIINLMRVPGVQQVMLQVKIAEVDRTGVREIGADILGVNPSTGDIMGTNIGGATVSALSTLGLGGLTGSATGDSSSNTTMFGIFPSGDFAFLLHALRKNSLLNVMAEPNLVALSGHKASFLAGGEFPVPVPQGTAGGSSSVTIEWKKFGVQVDFVPYVLEDGMIRLSVRPEVSTVDFALGTTLVIGGDRVPGLNTRRTDTTVELMQGQTLAISGLLTVEIDGQTSRIPGLGDLPYIGTMFSNTSHNRKEKELLVLVTPYLVQPMNPDEVPCLPGSDVEDPNDLEFYFLNRIAGRTGSGHRSTTNWDDPLGLVRHLRLERSHVHGPIGFSQ